ncbi:MAG: PQQ-binding-like beta-propeller repeat protein [Gemmatimonadaceae bacterium]|nr:PQQ-binding-like beta-propeller repeat protein [Gemmatimonadaceae bacterium]
MSISRWSTVALLATLGAPALGAQRVDWPTPSGDPGAMRWSPLADITRENVTQLAVAWRWRTPDRTVRAGQGQKAARPGQFQASPIMIGDTVFVSTPYAGVAALDARTGQQLWHYDSRAWEPGQPSNGTGFVHRGVATWSDGRERRVFINARWRLIALDASTGRPIRTFGDTGEVNLLAGLRRPVNPLHYTNTSPAVVWRDIVIVGNGVGDRLRYPKDPPGDVQAFDVRTGRRVWSFHTIPDAGEYGVDTWENGSWRVMGHTNVWAPMSVDTARGWVFLPVSTPTNDWYGGDRKGDNLFAESVVAVDIRTGKRVWHYQTVHHGLWDYDLPAPPVLATMQWNGHPRDVVVVPAKTGWLYVLDRQTGRPVWPIEERAVPASDVPGERAARTQPHPTRPAAFSRQAITPADLLAFTPELAERARAIFARHRSGPIFTPPSLEGTITMPGVIGGAGWGSTAFDPDSRTVYVKATEAPALFRIRKGTPNDTIGFAYTVDLSASAIGVTADPDSGRSDHTPPEALPLIAPPYGTLTAIDLDSGDRKWQVPLGDTPAIRSHPLLRDVTLPPLGVAGAPGAIVTRGGVLFATGGGEVLYALDTRDGRVLWQQRLRAGRGYANPVTYRASDGRQYVLIASGAGDDTELVAFALPSAPPTSGTLVAIVRHAERAGDASGDPDLTDAGRARARALAVALRAMDVQHILVTNRKRTQATAAPLAAERTLTPEIVGLEGTVADHVQRVAAAVRAQSGRAMLVVGHSNTVPAIIAALGGPAMPDLCDSAYANLFLLHLPADGAPPRLVRSSYGVADAPGADRCANTMR